jgi:hypothetical protein
VEIRIQSAIILLVVLHGCETWSVRLREGHRVRVFLNGLLKKIIDPGRQEVIADGPNSIISIFTFRDIHYTFG